VPLVRKRALMWFGAAVAVLALACAVNPVTGKRQLVLVSESQEIAMGREADPQIIAQYGLYDDPALAAYVDAIGQKMAKLSHRPNLEFHFRVLDSPVINAFALPGGYVYITRGILAYMNDEAELAIVLGHEIGHVTARHGVEQQTRQTLFGAGLGIGAILSPEVAQLGGVLQQGLGLLFLKYGRDDENQADELGVEYSLRAGYDAAAGAHFFEVLDRQTQESGQALPSWLSTHPAPADRVVHTQELARERMPQFPQATVVAEAAFKKQVDGIVFGEDPRQGFITGNLFEHPTLAFQVALPAGWDAQNTPSALLTAPKDRKALLQLTLRKDDGLSPQAYAQRVAEGAQARIVEGNEERIGGDPAYVALLRVPTDQGATTDALLGWVKRDAGMFQFLGQGAVDTYREPLLATIRSLQNLQDATAKKVQPNRVEVETLHAATTLEKAVGQAGSVPVPLATIALLNNLQPSSNLSGGFELKIVRGSFKPQSATSGS
jgi:predicted Zn-dependent protease